MRAGAAIPVDALGARDARRARRDDPGRHRSTRSAARSGPVTASTSTRRFDKGTDVARTLTVARSCDGRGVTRSDGLFGQQEGGVTAITLAVDPDAAIAVAFAARNGELDVVRAHGDARRPRPRALRRGLPPMSDDIAVIVCAGGASWELPLLRGLQRPGARCPRRAPLRRPRRAARHRAARSAARGGARRRARRGSTAISSRRSSEPASRSSRSAIAAAAATELGAVDVAADVDAAGARPRARRARARGRPPRAMRSRTAAGAGRLVVVWGGPGAPGRTTVAVHLAIESARRGRSTLLVDGDGWAASVAQLLELDESPSVAQAARLAGPRLADAARPTACSRARTGCAVLVGLPRAELWPEVRPEAWRAVLAAATRDLRHRRRRRRGADRGGRGAGRRPRPVPPQPHDDRPRSTAPTRCCS